MHGRSIYYIISDRFKNLPMNVHYTLIERSIDLLFNLKAAKKCEGVDGHDRMSAAS